MDARAALRLLAEFGADEALDDFPHDRFAESTPKAIEQTQAPQIVTKPASARPNLPAAAQAQATTEACQTIDQLHQALADFSCPLKTTATNLVFSDGVMGTPRIVVIGDVPGAEEDLTGKPFVGPSGKLLDQMLASIGLNRAKNCLLTNLIAWRPPGNRAPADSEIAICLAFLTRHLTLLAPDIVITLGPLPTEALTGQTGGIRRLRGKWREITLPGLTRPVPLLPMFHPGFALTLPIAKREIWSDLITISQKIAALSAR